MEEVGIGGERGAEEERGWRSKEPAGEKTNQKRRMREKERPKMRFHFGCIEKGKTLVMGLLQQQTTKLTIENASR